MVQHDGTTQTVTCTSYKSLDSAITSSRLKRKESGGFCIQLTTPQERYGVVLSGFDKILAQDCGSSSLQRLPTISQPGSAISSSSTRHPSKPRLPLDFFQTIRDREQLKLIAADFHTALRKCWPPGSSSQQ